MSKFDFFDEGVRKVFENFELSAEENAWNNFEAYLSGGARAFSFLKSLVLPGILATSIIATLHVASEKHLQNNELAHHKLNTPTENDRIFDQHTDLTQNQSIIDHSNGHITSSENAESTTMNFSDTANEFEDQVDQPFHDSDQALVSSNHDQKTSSNKTTNRDSYSSSSNAMSKNLSGKAEKNEAQNSNTIKFVGRAFRLDAPAKFTPNNDGINDTFMPPALSKTANFQLFVYNADGDLVFMTDRVENAWTGKLMSSDEDAPEGHYEWRVELSVDQNLHQYAGKVQLFR